MTRTRNMTAITILAFTALLAPDSPLRAAEPTRTFTSISIHNVPDVQVRYDERSHVELPQDAALAGLLSVQVSEGVLQLSCMQECERLRGHPIVVSTAALNAIQLKNGGLVRVLSQFPPTLKLSVELGNGGEIDASNLPGDSVHATLHNGGKLYLTACSDLRAELVNGGEVLYGGSPKIELQRSNGGELRQKQEQATACSRVIDSRDQHHYRTVSIGALEWFAENLAWLPRVCPLSDSDCGIWVYGLDSNNLSAARAADHFQRFGALYNWETATNACPEGWRLPSDHDWQALEAALGMPQAELAQTIWRGPPLATQMKLGGDSGLQIALAGWRSGDGRFLFAGEHANFWTATSAHEQHAIERLIGRNKSQIGRHTGNVACGFSVRCVRDRKPLTSNASE